MGKIQRSNRSSVVQRIAGEVAYSAASNTIHAAAECVRELLTEHIPVLREVAWRLCRGDLDDVEDLVQDVFERALRFGQTLNVAKNPRGWMVTILHNLHIDRYRRRARHGQHVPLDESSLTAPELLAPPDWAGLTADDVRRAAARLPSELRDAYVMFALEDHTYAEVAAALGIPTSTVGTRIMRARARIKEILVAALAAEGT